MAGPGPRIGRAIEAGATSVGLLASIGLACIQQSIVCTMTNIQQSSSFVPFRRSAQGALALACAASLLGAACGDDTNAGPDAAPEVDPALLIPVAGLWRAVMDGSPEMCGLGGSGPFVLREKTVGEFFPLPDGSLFVKNIDGLPFLTCSLSTPGFYACEAEEDTTEFEGDSYTLTQSLSMEFTGTMAGIVTNTATLVCSGTGCASTEPCVDILTYTGTPFVETEALADLDCAQEATIASDSGSSETYIDVVNNTDETLVRFWLDFEGARVAFPPALAPGETSRKSTFEGHAWLFEDSTGACRGIFKTGSDIGVATID